MYVHGFLYIFAMHSLSRLWKTCPFEQALFAVSQHSHQDNSVRAPKRSTHDIRFIFACQVKNLFRGKVHQNAKKKRYYVPDLGAKAGHISIIRARHPLYSCLVCGPVASASAAASLRGLLLPCEPMGLRFTPLFQQRAALLTEISAAAYGRIWQIVTGEALPED